jgi:hypothetical protein
VTAYEVSVVEVESRTFATLHGSAPLDDPVHLEATVFAITDLVVEFLREFNVPSGALILKYDARDLVAVGYEVFDSIPNAHGVFLDSTPACLAASTMLSEADAPPYLAAKKVIGDWCETHGFEPTGQSWEISELLDPGTQRSSLFVELRDQP